MIKADSYIVTALCAVGLIFSLAVYFFAERRPAGSFAVPPEISNVRVVRENELFFKAVYDRKDDHGTMNFDSVHWYVDGVEPEATTNAVKIRVAPGDGTREIHCKVRGGNQYAIARAYHRSEPFILPPEAPTVLGNLNASGRNTGEFRADDGWYKYVNGELYKIEMGEQVLWGRQYYENGVKFRQVKNDVLFYDEASNSWLNLKRKNIAARPNKRAEAAVEFVLTGRVVDMYTNEPVPGASVRLKDRNAICDAGGNYAIAVNSRAEKFAGRLSAEHPDYFLSEVRRFTMSKNGSYDIPLIPRSKSEVLAAYNETGRSRVTRKWKTTPKFLVHTAKFGNSGYSFNEADAEVLKKYICDSVPVVSGGFWKNIGSEEILVGDHTGLMEQTGGLYYAKDGHVILVCDDSMEHAGMCGPKTAGNEVTSCLIMLKTLSEGVFKHELYHAYTNGLGHTRRDSLMTPNEDEWYYTELDKKVFEMHNRMPEGACAPYCAIMDFVLE